jgi:3-phosphoshikimate 1-carboxyvinyltransferase
MYFLFVKMVEIIPIYKSKSVNTQKVIRIPGSKSYTNRALLLAALANGKSTISNPLASDDTDFMGKALHQLGINIIKKENQYLVLGKGGKFTIPHKPLYLGNAGTAVRFLTATLAATGPACIITGDKRMRERPIKDLTTALANLGALITTNKDCPPVTITKALEGGQTTVNGQISSQYLSALLMASPYAKKAVKIVVKNRLNSLPYVKMTLDTMRRFGLTVKKDGFREFKITPSIYKATKYLVEGDASSASYFWAIAAINGITVKVVNIDLSSAQADIGFIKIAKKMGCTIKGGKNFITLNGPATLKPLGTVDLHLMPDSAMTMAILAAFAKGKSTLKGLSTLRVKECDRLKALATELNRIGIKTIEGKDFLEIHGNPDGGNSGIIDTYNDHRMAMCFAVAGTRIPGIKILDPGCVSKTYPGFWKDLKKIGISLIGDETTKNEPAKKRHRTDDVPGKNIILTGLRGTGKTLVGLKLAKILSYEFLDTDKLIEKQSKMPIAEIVRKYGWKKFRQLETIAAKKIAAVKRTVVSTGGGMVVNPTNAAILKKNSIIVLLRCDRDISARRIMGDMNRPALTNQKNPTKELEELWRKRKEVYLRTADLIIDTSAQSDNINSDLQRKATQIHKLISA